MLKLLGILGAVVLVCLLGFAYFYFRSPEMAPPANIVVDKSPERVERGKYIFTRLSDCDFCHSEQDITRLALPIIESTRGQGKLMADTDLPGKIYAANITPDVETGIGSWTDGEKIRAIREGVDKNGRALYPIMPYPFYRYMSDEDVQAVVAFLDTIPPIKHQVPLTKVNFPDSMWMKGDPRPHGTQKNAGPEQQAAVRTVSDHHCPLRGLPYAVSGNEGRRVPSFRRGAPFHYARGRRLQR